MQPGVETGAELVLEEGGSRARWLPSLCHRQHSLQWGTSYWAELAVSQNKLQITDLGIEER